MVFLVDCAAQIVGVGALAIAVLGFLLFDLTLVNLVLVLDDSAPFVEVSPLVSWVVPHLLAGQSPNLVILQLKRLLDSVGHLEGIHNCFCTFLHFAY